MKILFDLIILTTLFRITKGMFEKYCTFKEIFLVDPKTITVVLSINQLNCGCFRYMATVPAVAQLISESILTTFKFSVVFRGSWGSSVMV
jgi:hypothetical protein